MAGARRVYLYNVSSPQLYDTLTDSAPRGAARVRVPAKVSTTARGYGWSCAVCCRRMFGSWVEPGAFGTGVRVPLDIVYRIRSRAASRFMHHEPVIP